MTPNMIIFSLHKRRIPEEEMLTLQFDKSPRRLHCLVKKKGLITFMSKQSKSWDAKVDNNKLIMTC